MNEAPIIWTVDVDLSDGEWAVVIRRPVSLGEIADRVASLA